MESCLLRADENLIHLFEVEHGPVRTFVPAVGIQFGEFDAELASLGQFVGDVGVKGHKSELFAGFPKDPEGFSAIAIVAADLEFQFFANGAGPKDFLAVDAVGVLLGHAAKFNGMMPTQADHAGAGP